MSRLQRLAQLIDAANEHIGRVVSWLALVMVIIQVIVVIMRYVFGLGSIFMQESIIYMHAIVFLIAAGYTLLHNGHVRIDIFYGAMDARRRAIVDLVGTVVFLVPFCVTVFVISWPYVAKSWRILEVSQEGSGIPAIFLLKSVILVFTVLLLGQGLSLAARSLLTLYGVAPPPATEEEGEAVL